MGGSSSSSTSSSNRTEQTDNRVAVEAGGIGIGAHAQVTTQVTDFGVLEAAENVLRDGLGEAANIVESVTENFAGIVSENNKILSEQAESDAKEITELAVKVMAAVVVIIGFIMFWGRK